MIDKEQDGLKKQELEGFMAQFFHVLSRQTSKGQYSDIIKDKIEELYSFLELEEGDLFRFSAVEKMGIKLFDVKVLENMEEEKLK